MDSKLPVAYARPLGHGPPLSRFLVWGPLEETVRRHPGWPCGRVRLLVIAWTPISSGRLCHGSTGLSVLRAAKDDQRRE